MKRELPIQGLNPDGTTFKVYAAKQIHAITPAAQKVLDMNGIAFTKVLEDHFEADGFASNYTLPDGNLLWVESSMDDDGEWHVVCLMEER